MILVCQTLTINPYSNDIDTQNQKIGKNIFST